MASIITENLKFFSLFFKSKDVMIFNGLVALGTVGSQELFSVVAFHCPCSPGRNYMYGLAAIGVPALVLFLIGIMLNNHTWNLVAECQKRALKNCSTPATFLLFGSILGRALVAPVTWSVISLLRGEAYVCARSEFLNPTAFLDFPSEYGPDSMARFSCPDTPKELIPFKDEVIRRLKYESQFLGWILIAVIASAAFLLKCLQHCCTPLSFHQEDYWKQYRYAEKDLFNRTAEVHAKVLAANNVKQFFGFVALDKDEKDIVSQYPVDEAQTSPQWQEITGVYLYRENKGFPLYSRLHKWTKKVIGNGMDPDGREMALLAV
ncbi:calcium homeostasis modulator 2 S homeolog [Xenopus laevis]|uniref:Calcium homeostasis modulator 2 S homeolog n=1 Tax=Xenopus laevis TaxID=8355 RepID=Q6DFD8_XENLA|nr:calcium homeostasis modulator 2 S homeolog [Xenopus laevis]AAH76801.1 MGC83740 protein [Xenopus laevis]